MHLLGDLPELCGHGLRKLADLRSCGLRFCGQQRLYLFAKRLTMRIGHTANLERHEDPKRPKDCDDCSCAPAHHALLLYRESTSYGGKTAG